MVRCDLGLDTITPNPFQPRRDINPSRADFLELVANIREQGLLQPIVVTAAADERDRYVLVAGERRWRAFQTLSQESPKYLSIAATIIALSPERRDVCLRTKGLSENVLRIDLDAAELASAIARMHQEAGMTYEVIAHEMGMAVKRVQNLAAIAKHETVMAAVRNGDITQSQAITIGYGAEREEQAVQLVAQAKGKDIKTTARMVRAVSKKPEPKQPEPRVLTPPDRVNVDQLPIASIIGGGMTSREEIYRAIERTCAILGWWPAKPEGPPAEFANVRVYWGQNWGQKSAKLGSTSKSYADLSWF
jgi:ParB family chromosome partitioning protein